ncbi:MAG: bifunctional folylpolyglutamate synthase/dihydrofolate synthase [Pedosphaera sp.]|nr:bifunctional folylpolyglutamate synthase/dihydrofolate synthase [Pedosphaera sp.]
MTYPEAINWLYELRLFGSKLGLENPRQLAAHAGNPHDQLNIIHVAGTNGKGSVCAMLESIYRRAGYKTGLFTSPHLVSFRERIQVNRELVPEADVVRLTECMQALLRHFPADQPPTFFEVVTLMALEHFAREKCDVVLLETGLGGRLDATNIVTPIASVITSIALDHQQHLGDTLTEIAAEKAGIIKPRIPVFSTGHQPEISEVIRNVAAQNKAPLKFVETEVDTCLAGKHQRLNSALAQAITRGLHSVFPIDDQAIVDGLANVQWAGRAQCFEKENQRLLIDAAHNPASAEALRDVLQENFAGQRPILLIGMLADKNWKPFVEVIAPMADRIVCIPVSSERTLSPAQLAGECRRHCSQVMEVESLLEGLETVKGDPFVILTGSIYLIGEAMEELGLADAVGERGLNEWKMSQP